MRLPYTLESFVVHCTGTYKCCTIAKTTIAHHCCFIVSSVWQCVVSNKCHQIVLLFLWPVLYISLLWCHERALTLERAPTPSTFVPISFIRSMSTLIDAHPGARFMWLMEHTHVMHVVLRSTASSSISVFWTRNFELCECCYMWLCIYGHSYCRHTCYWNTRTPCSQWFIMFVAVCWTATLFWI